MNTRDEKLEKDGWGRYKIPTRQILFLTSSILLLMHFSLVHIHTDGYPIDIQSKRIIVNDRHYEEDVSTAWSEESFLRGKVLSTNEIILDKNHSCKVIRRSNVFSSKCNNKGTDALPLLITGTGRSGTDYLTKMLNLLGLDMSHDTVGPGEDGGVSWPQAFNERLCKPPKWNWRRDTNHLSNKGKIYRFMKVAHVVRNPLNQILSRANNGGFLRSDNRRMTGCNTHSENGINVKAFSEQGMSNVEISMILALRHWVLFNSFIEKYASFIFRIEDFSVESRRLDIISRIFSLAKASERLPSDDDVLSLELSSKTNHKHTKKPKSFKNSWKKLSELDEDYAKIAQLMALRYGYVITKEELLEGVLEDCADGFRLALLDCSFQDDDKWSCSLVCPC